MSGQSNGGKLIWDHSELAFSMNKEFQVLSASNATPIKIGKFSPGTHIPIKTHNEFKNNYPDYALLFGYNHSKEIFAKEQDFVEKGGKWITYVPEVKII